MYTHMCIYICMMSPAGQGEYVLPWEQAYSGVTLNVARPDMNNYATLGVMLY